MPLVGRGIHFFLFLADRSGRRRGTGGRRRTGRQRGEPETRQDAQRARRAAQETQA